MTSEDLSIEPSHTLVVDGVTTTFEHWYGYDPDGDLTNHGYFALELHTHESGDPGATVEVSVEFSVYGPEEDIGTVRVLDDGSFVVLARLPVDSLPRLEATLSGPAPVVLTVQNSLSPRVPGYYQLESFSLVTA